MCYRNLLLCHNGPYGKASNPWSKAVAIEIVTEIEARKEFKGFLAFCVELGSQAFSSRAQRSLLVRLKMPQQAALLPWCAIACQSTTWYALFTSRSVKAVAIEIATETEARVELQS